MSEYKDIKGFKVQTVSTDPAASIGATGTWTSGGSLNTARAWQAGTGTQTAALSISGETPTKVTNVESYNGSSWTEIADVNLARVGLSGAGTQTASLVAGGFYPPSAVVANAESWNGTSWTEVNDLNTARYGVSSTTSSSTATVAFGGYTGTTMVANTESWDGTSWTEVNDLNQARYIIGGSGTQTAGLAFGGNSDPPYWSNTETWDGTSWTEVSDLNTARFLNGSGTQTSTLGFGGYTGSASALTEFWDGTSWTEVSDLSTARYTVGGTGANNTSAIAFGGQPGGGVTGATEEWTMTATPTTFSKENLGQVFYNSTSNAFKVTQQSVSSGTWSSGSSLNTAKTSIGGAGTQTSAIAAGGRNPAIALVLGNVELYDGSSWTETTDLNTARRHPRTTAAVNTAAIVYGGPSNLTPPFEANQDSVELWNGSSWTETTEMNTPRGNAANGNLGTSSTDAFLVGGYGNVPPPSAPRANAEVWNGTSWTEVADLNTSRYDLGGFGTTTSTLVFGGVNLSIPGNTAATESYNGTSWTEVADLATACGQVVGAGQSNTSGIRFMAESPSTLLATTEFWNGTSWTELNDLSTARSNGAGAGSATSALAFGGYNGTAYTGVTEEWTAATSNSTLTAS